LRLIKEKGFSNKDSQYLLKGLKQRLGYSISIDIDYVQKIERTKSGKYQFIISKFYDKKK
jgi:phenylacetate-coenzyme A ligase PaaK-like adenylate-forming protein